MKKIPTKPHCLKVKSLLRLSPDKCEVIYHRGRVQQTRDDTDVELDFRQESHFFYLTGVDEPGFHVLVDLLKEQVYLVPPTVTDYEILWKGPPDTHAQLLEKYDVDHIVSEDALAGVLRAINPAVIHVLDTTDHSALLEAGISHRVIDKTLLQVAMTEARLIKFPWEIQLVRYAAQVSSHAHIALMKNTRSGMEEANLEARFRWVCAENGCLRQSYLPIVASGPRAATLHYVKNNQTLPSDPHQLVLVDAGCEWHCYGSDVTRTFPISGKFSPEARTIYEIVLKAQKAVLSQLKPGTIWADMQTLVYKIICQELVRIGILVGPEEELLRLGIPKAFYFHGTGQFCREEWESLIRCTGVGHSVGLDVHDVGGRSIGILQMDRMQPKSQLLFNRPLEANMVVTVEPGLYFNDTSLRDWTCSQYKKYFNLQVLEQYRLVGGVRIEDTVVITADGIDNLTIVPKEVEAIEKIMNCH
ncbi:hypothetical protein DFQ28_001806 [Apophysomyces sp. BC1034]|nr:hypothetical protein DFQ30_002405 [Apophysomyces sp. BC1015]KAG0180754.1 hypothetical protein DFQ29_010195 [Apophysomyces sp. BC1021]KAG0190599.1 hypothetical protein DFQ28_001806 [Apophysomyces sp. BC1034]